MKIFVVVPAYNEGKRIAPVLSQISKMGFKAVVVDDGSSDNTGRIAKRFSPHVIRHPINLGKGAALKTGCLAAFKLGAEAVIIMDSDGQHKASDLPKFVKALKRCAVVLGRRNLEKIPLVRGAGNKLISFLVKFLFGIEAEDVLCGFKAFTKRAFAKIRWDSVGYSVEAEIVAMTGKHGLRYCQVPVSTVYYDRFKGLTPESGIEILLDLFLFKLR